MIRKILAFILSLFMILPSGVTATEGEDAAELSLYAINVGKADALLLRSGKTAYLIDTGSEDSYPKLEKALQAEGITHLDGVILTHTHKDHAGGLEYLMDSGIEIDQVYASGYYNRKEKKHPAVQALKGTGREVNWLLSGDSLPLEGGKLEVLGPLVHDEEKENNNSLVLLATGGGAVLRAENVEALRRNGRLFWLDRAADDLVPTDDRPLADSREKMKALYEARRPVYRATADETVPVRGTAEDAARVIESRWNA